ncbi:MAG TPA: cysteine desulfurase family protein [Nannocystaceae bacterium]|nr:cysteine desulfurase family protein [Nannocystaceae bacterium]
MIDFDHNATTPLRPEVRTAMMEVLGREDLGNPSSVHRPGQRARGVLEQARRSLAESLGAAPGEIVFTSGGTEADALAILGGARALRAAGRPCAVACAAIEHPAVTGAVAILRREGIACPELATDRDGRIDGDALVDLLARDRTIGLVSIAAAHHELGNVPALPALVQRIREVAPGVLVHSDAVQAFGKIACARAALGVDLLSISAHKIGGPIGVGALVVAREVAIDPPWGGGAQQAGRRPGTESVVLAVGFATAARSACARLPEWDARVRPLGERMRAGLAQLGARLVGDREHHVGNTALVELPGCDGQLAVIALDLAGFHCSTGAACSAGTVEPSRVLLALGRDRDAAKSAVRFSIGHEHTAADIDALLDALADILPRVRGAA